LFEHKRLARDRQLARLLTVDPEAIIARAGKRQIDQFDLALCAFLGLTVQSV
jgi:hypothetical protein